MTIAWKTAASFVDNNCLQMSAALSYYTLLSIAPLILLALIVAGVWWDQAAASAALLEEMDRLMGPAGADVVKTILRNAGDREKARSATLTGLATLAVGATAVFLSMQDAMNVIWQVEPRVGRRVWAFIRKRILSTVVIGCIGLLLIVSLLASTAFTAVDAFLANKWEGASRVLHWVDFNQWLSFATSFLLFGIIFKLLPDVLLEWRDVFWGALGTAVLFTLGKKALGSYLSNWELGHTYGAAGTVVVFLVWVYYSSAIIFLGAQFTCTRLQEMGVRVRVASHARFKYAAEAPTR